MKILVIRFSSIGDIILTSPIVRCIKLQKQAEVHFLVKKEFREKKDFEDTLKLIKKYNALDTTFKRAEYFVNVSYDALGIFENSEEKNVLQNLTSFSLNRSY